MNVLKTAGVNSQKMLLANNCRKLIKSTKNIEEKKTLKEMNKEEAMSYAAKAHSDFVAQMKEKYGDAMAVRGTTEEREEARSNGRANAQILKDL